MPVPPVQKIEVSKISAKCYTRNQFRSYVLDPLLLFAGKDDNGNPKKPELDNHDEYTYDKMLLNVEKEIKNFLQVDL